MRLLPCFVCSAILGAGVFVASGQPGPPNSAPSHGVTHITLPPVPKPLLPEAFSGWVTPKPPQRLADADAADPKNAAALREYGFVDGALATYTRGSESLTVRALRFPDASGAFGAYSFYRQNNWPKEEIGSGATSDHNRVLFWQGNLVVDANFSAIGAMSGSEMRDLASQLPRAEGSKLLLPPILSSLPKAQLDGQTTHYAVGPAGYAGAGGVLPPALVGFHMGAETATANYSLRSGVATLTIIDYPTPQMAAAEESRIRDYIGARGNAQPPWPKPLADSDLASLEVRRSGPLVSIVSGDAIPDESHKLLALVHFETGLTSLPQAGDSEIAKTGRLLVGIAWIVIIGSVAAIILGFSVGGFRALYRLARGKPVSSMYEVEFIGLNLRNWHRDQDQPERDAHPER